ncbi:MAG: VOC family protein [Novosphingobium sp.]|nr:VOC family protein [Novosphingobium sp.]
MFFKGHYQNAYITHDMDKCMAAIDDRFGKIDWIVFEPDMILKTPHGDKESSVRAALGWQAGHQIELIQPVKGYLDHYKYAMREDKNDWRPVFHHVAVRRDDEAAMRAEIEELGFPLLFESSVPGLVFIYLDARETIGHAIEYIWATPEGWDMQGWPKDRPVY